MKEFTDLHDKVDMHKYDKKLKKRLESLQDSYYWIRRMVLSNETGVMNVQRACQKLETEFNAFNPALQIPDMNARDGVEVATAVGNSRPSTEVVNSGRHDSDH